MQLTAIIDNLDPSASKAISYDALNRLVQVAEGTEVAGPSGTPIPVEDYAYDGEGNRTASHISAFYASNAHNQLLEDDTYTYAYDTKGNRISRTSKVTGDVETYTYDSQNRLVAYASPTVSASYAYDALERRIAKTVGGVVAAYTYDTSLEEALAYDDVVMEWEASDTSDSVLKHRWVHADSIDEPIGFEAYTNSSIAGDGLLYEVYADRMGSISVVVEVATGLVVSDYDYDSFGVQSDPADAIGQLFGYTGRNYDSESGLGYFRARYYSPETGRFIQSDPVEFDGGDLNLYAYVENSPFNFTDPTGLVRRSGKPRSTGGGGTSTTQYFTLGDGQDLIREAAIEAVAQGVFGIGAVITGQLAYSSAKLDAIAQFYANHKKHKPGGQMNDHHCWPVYQSDNRKAGYLLPINRRKHNLLHAMMQEYMSVYNMRTSPTRGGRVIRRQLNRAYMQKVTRQFYDDMYMYFRINFGC